MKSLKILLVDIETSPLLSYTWGIWEQNVVGVKEDWYMMCFAYKWLGDKNTKAHALPEYTTYKKNKSDDKQLVSALWRLFNEADIIIGHNGDKFDIKKANARFLAHGLTPPSAYRTIDTVKVARKYFAMNSNKLNEIGKYLKIGQKIDTGGFQLWIDCMAGDLKAWDRMVKYNKQDVALLEKVYLTLRPWIKGHPNLNVVEDGCPSCGADTLQKRGFGYTQTGTYQRFQCTTCAAWSKGLTESAELEVKS